MRVIAYAGYKGNSASPMKGNLTKHDSLLNGDEKFASVKILTAPDALACVMA